MKKRINKNYLILFIICAIGLLIRSINVFWGYPYQYHPDEPTVVESAINMLSRNSYEAFVYNRPDHFEIKCSAFIFQIFSWIKYRMPAVEAFSLHPEVFYVLSRFFTVFCGMVIVILSYFFMEKIKKGSGIWASLLMAFFPVFVQHSAYATPDIPLACMVLGISYLSIDYLEKGSKNALAGISILTGISITIKYPGAISCLFIAIIVCTYAILHKEYKNIMVHGIFSIVIILGTVFIIAPNLYTNIEAVIATLKKEARPNHLGADGLSFLGNLKYYWGIVIGTMGYIFYLPFVIGVICIIKKWKKAYISLFLGAVFWVFLSFMPLHWERWGTPMYLTPILIASVGIVEFYGYLKTQKETNTGRGGYFWIAGNIVIIILFSNLIFSSLAVMKSTRMVDTRAVAKDYCDEKSITIENSIYEGYTPLKMGFAESASNKFILKDEQTIVQEKYATKKYLVISNSFKGRYNNDAANYPEEVAIYKGIEKNYPLLYTVSGKGYPKYKFAVRNIASSIRYLSGSWKEYTGGTISIYDLQPNIVAIYPVDVEGYLLGVTNQSKERGANVELVQIDKVTESLWTIYNQQNETISLLNNDANMALDVTKGTFQSGTNIEQWDITSEIPQRWSILKENNVSYILCENNMALTYDKNTKNVTIEPFVKNQNQKWKITDIEQ